jgi:hypothetical protein
MDSILFPIRRKLLFENPGDVPRVLTKAEPADEVWSAAPSRPDPGVVDALLLFVKRATTSLAGTASAVLTSPSLTAVREGFRYLSLHKAAWVLQVKLADFGIIADHALCVELMSVILPYTSGKALPMFADMLSRLRASRLANTDKRKRLLVVLASIVNMLLAGDFVLTYHEKISKLLDVGT